MFLCRHGKSTPQDKDKLIKKRHVQQTANVKWAGFALCQKIKKKNKNGSLWTHFCILAIEHQGVNWAVFRIVWFVSDYFMTNSRKRPVIKSQTQTPGWNSLFSVEPPTGMRLTSEMMIKWRLSWLTEISRTTVNSWLSYQHIQELTRDVSSESEGVCLSLPNFHLRTVQVISLNAWI